MKYISSGIEKDIRVLERAVREDRIRLDAGPEAFAQDVVGFMLEHGFCSLEYKAINGLNWLTTEQAKIYTGLSAKTLKALAQEGLISGRQILTETDLKDPKLRGRHSTAPWRFSRISIDSYLFGEIPDKMREDAKLAVKRLTTTGKLKGVR